MRGAVARAAVSSVLWPYLVANTALSIAAARMFPGGRTHEASLQERTRRWACRNLRWGGFRLAHLEGTEGLPRPCVLAVNHQSPFDVAVLAALVPPPLRFVARVEVLSVPLIGSVLRGGGHLTVRRGAGLDGNDEALRRAAEVVRDDGCAVAFFPEGTRSPDGRIGPLRGGAFRVAAAAGVPLVPVVIAGSRHALSRVPGPIVPARIAVAFLPPRRVGPQEARSADGRDAVRAEMSAALDRLSSSTGPRL